MKKIHFFGLLILVILLSSVPSLGQAERQFDVIQFPEGREVEIDFVSSGLIPGAEMKSKVKFQDGQFRIEIEFDDMKPAVLFGGDVTCYVLWAFNRDGAPENLGEFWVRPDREDDTLRFSTGLRNFALVITAERYYQVSRPSEMVLFWNGSNPDPPVTTAKLSFDQFDSAPESGVETLQNVRYDGDKPLDLVQAEKVFELARAMGAEEYSPDLFSQASLSLRQATQVYQRSRGTGAQRFARDSVAASNEAIRLTSRKLALKALEEEFAERQAQMNQLEARLNQSEERFREAEARIEEVQEERAEAERQINSARLELQSLNREREQLVVEKRELEASLVSLSREREQLEQEKAALLVEKEELVAEKAQLQGRLQEALSEVADTRSSARGMIVNLPDILFSIGEAELIPQLHMGGESAKPTSAG